MLRPKDIAVLVAINVLWGASAVAAKTAMGALHPQAINPLQPHTVAFLRFGIASIVLVGMLRIQGEVIQIERSDRNAFLALGLLGTSLAYSLFYLGADRTTASETNPASRPTKPSAGSPQPRRRSSRAGS